MGTKRLLTLLTLVAILGGVAIWNIKTMQEKRTMEFDVAMMESGTTSTGTEVETDQDSSDSTSASESSVGMPSGSDNTSEATTDASIDSDLEALDAMYADEYDDSSLDTTFSSDGAAVLAEPYDI